MRVTFWGTRGSIAKPGPSTIRYGGNTSCVEVRTSGGTLLVIDAGTGIHALGERLLAEADAAPTAGHLLVTHTHWDHIQGLPFFGPLFVPGHRWQVHGPAGLSTSLADTLGGQMDYAYFPVGLDELQASIDFHDLVEGTFEIDDVRITARYLNHPALTLGYRIEADGHTIVYASDHEPCDPALARGGDLLANPGDAAHVDFLRGADLVIHDAQYLAAEYETGRCGWGHSPVEYVVDAARLADVGELALFHHDPSRTDDLLDDLLSVARTHAARVGYDGRVTPAIEGQSVDLGVRDREARPDPANSATQSAFAASAANPSERPCAVCIDVADPDAADAVRAAAAAEHIAVVADPGEAEITIVDREVCCEHSGRRLSMRLTAVGSTNVDHHHQLSWPSPHVYVRTKLRAWLLDHVHGQRHGRGDR